jgi:predicted dehydrogenase
MGRAHSNAYSQVEHFFDSEYQCVLQAACARDAAKVKTFADRWGYKTVETDWRKLIQRDDIDLIDIAVPNNLHAEMAIAAARAGKIILCEKPLAMNPKEGEKMVAAVKRKCLIWFNNHPAVRASCWPNNSSRKASSERFSISSKVLQD